MRKIARKKLIDHISSEYFESWGAMSSTRRTVVYVEGWEDIAFWRAVFDDFEDQGRRKFEIMTPARSDMAKGKKVVLGFVDKAGSGLILCVDSDFDYLFGDHTYQSTVVNGCPFVVQTYVYSIENLLCLPSSLNSIATKITKNDTPTFDFEDFFVRYSKIIYPLFLWYIFASKIDRPNIFTLSEFRNAVKINYIMVDDNGESTLEWLEKHTAYRVSQLNKRHASMRDDLATFEQELIAKGVTNTHVYLHMQGHTLLDNVVKIILQAVCNNLRQITVNRIANARSEPITKRNEMGAYNNALRDIDTVVADNTLYKRTEHYAKITDKIKSIISKK